CVTARPRSTRRSANGRSPRRNAAVTASTAWAGWISAGFAQANASPRRTRGMTRNMDPMPIGGRVSSRRTRARLRCPAPAAVVLHVGTAGCTAGIRPERKPHHRQAPAIVRQQQLAEVDAAEVRDVDVVVADAGAGKRRAVPPD